MYCKKCGNELEGNNSVCTKCGYFNEPDYTFCQFCGKPIAKSAMTCIHCGRTWGGEVHGQKSKLAAGLLGLFFGNIGVHNFYLGFTGKGVVQIVLSIFTCGIGGIWGFIESIMILAGAINKDAKGIPLKD